MHINPLLNVDSYKFSHYKQYPPGTEYVYSYIESRGGQYTETCFFGLNAFIQEYILKPFTQADINEAQEIAESHGEPFNKEGFDYILKTYQGRWPVTIRAVPEGSVIEGKNVLLDIINTDPKCFWVTSFLETALLRAVWYGTTVATREFKIRETIQKYLRETADDTAMAGIGFKHNDFGSRGASSYETSMLGGMAHLAIFMGTDNIPAIKGARDYYGEKMAGYSIPAAEHSTMTSWGGEAGEQAAMSNMITQFGKPGALIACVSDSYNIHRAVKDYWCGSLLEQLKASGATVVIRPDSGDPVETPVKVIEDIMKYDHFTLNSKGFKMLPKYFRVIQGDGVDLKPITQICYNLKDRGISTDNIAFGMGGAMLQKMDRDTQKFAMKCSAICVNGVWRDVFKAPIGDVTKVSKKGRLDLIRDGKNFKTVKQGYQGPWTDKGIPYLFTVYENLGQGYIPVKLSDVRQRVEHELAMRGY